MQLSGRGPELDGEDQNRKKQARASRGTVAPIPRDNSKGQKTQKKEKKKRNTKKDRVRNSGERQCGGRDLGFSDSKWAIVESKGKDNPESGEIKGRVLKEVRFSAAGVAAMTLFYSAASIALRDIEASVMGFRVLDSEKKAGFG